MIRSGAAAASMGTPVSHYAKHMYNVSPDVSKFCLCSRKMEVITVLPTRTKNYFYKFKHSKDINDHQHRLEQNLIKIMILLLIRSSGKGTGRKGIPAPMSLTLRADDTCREACPRPTAAPVFLVPAVAEGHLLPCAPHTAPDHLRHIGAVPVPCFLGNNNKLQG